MTYLEMLECLACGKLQTRQSAEEALSEWRTNGGMWDFPFALAICEECGSEELADAPESDDSGANKKTKDSFGIGEKVGFAYRDKSLCQRCEKLVSIFHSDCTIGHRLAWKDGGSNSNENLGLECRACNIPSAETLPLRADSVKQIDALSALVIFSIGFAFDAVRGEDVMAKISPTATRYANRLPKQFVEVYEVAKAHYEQILIPSEREQIALMKQARELRSRF